MNTERHHHGQWDTCIYRTNFQRRTWAVSILLTSFPLHLKQSQPQRIPCLMKPEPREAKHATAFASLANHNKQTSTNPNAAA